MHAEPYVQDLTSVNATAASVANGDKDVLSKSRERSAFHYLERLFTVNTVIYGRCNGITEIGTS